MKRPSTPQILVAVTVLIFALLLLALVIDPNHDEESEPDGPIGEVRLV